MKFDIRKLFTGLTAAVAVILGSAGKLPADEQEESTQKKTIERRVEVQLEVARDEKQKPATSHKQIETDKGRKYVEIQKRHVVQLPAPGKFWIGISMGTPGPALRAQLGLAENQGLIVEEVSVGTPAEKAGIQLYDVLIRVGDQELSTPQQLVETVQKAGKGGEVVKLTLLRSGKEQTIIVKPDERKVIDRTLRQPLHNLNRAELDELRKWIERGSREQLKDSPNYWRLRTLRPGIHLDRQGDVRPPEGLKSIKIQKEGNEPATILIEIGNKQWQTTEDKLDVLPDDVRSYVEQVLGKRGQIQFTLPKAKSPIGLPGPPHLPTMVLSQESKAPSREESLEKRLDETDRRLEQLRKAAEDLTKMLEDLQKESKDRDKAARQLEQLLKADREQLRKLTEDLQKEVKNRDKE